MVRNFPMVPGIDFAGTRRAQQPSRFKAGDEVLLNGWGVGETHWGGLAQQARVKGDWLVPLPAGFNARRPWPSAPRAIRPCCACMALEHHGVTPDDGAVLVTGANGGVGSVAIALLARLGFEVLASTGRAAKPSTSSAWAPPKSSTAPPVRAGQAAGQGALGRRRSTRSAATRWPTSARPPATAARSRPAGWRRAWISRPRGALHPARRDARGRRQRDGAEGARVGAWDRLARDLDRTKLKAMTETRPIADVVALASDVLAGKVRGRIVLEVA